MYRYIFLLLSIVLSGGLFASGKDTTGPRQISIMTYNVKLLPRGATWIHHHPVKRARLIPAKVLEDHPDVVVFEEAFDGVSVRLLKKGLQSTYPYMAGQHNRRLVTYKRAGGVLVFSRYPMQELESIKYSQCKGADCYGHKGAILVQVDHPAGRIQVLGTHLQAGGSVDLKASQYLEAAGLLDRHQQQGVPQFIAGDFNTHKDDTLLYNRLTTAMKGADGDVDDELKILTAHTLNDLRRKNNGHPKKSKSIIDYVFVKANGAHITSQHRYTREYQQPWSQTNKDLSDHFAVILNVRM